jgi:uncharacterized protein YjbJ (UPF0337 family)
MSGMNWTLAEDSWQQFKGTVRARWLQLNDEHLDAIGGKRPELLRKIQEVYGLTRAEADREVKAFEARNRNYRPRR